VVIGGYSIKTWNEKYYPNSTMNDVIAHSDNTGMVFVGRKLGREKLLTYISKFGFGQKTGIDLQEESQASLKPASAWYEIDTATVTFGQGIAVTPMQMVRAVGAIANRGKLVAPHIVAKIGDKTTKNFSSQQIISSTAASEMTKIMIDSVNRGDAKWTRPKDILIAGKTGTAQIPVQGHYDKDKTIASFVGFAPADAPKFVMLVTLQEPQTSQWGSETAAPLWFDISRELLARYN
jgi:cell division protein FtsI (penicillin-binding protein 3)/stage V sporulation protein D (sporulation-specific penicillin-binding protein)